MGNLERRSVLQGMVAAVGTGTVAMSAPGSRAATALIPEEAGAVDDPLRDVLTAYDLELREFGRRLKAEGDDMTMDQPVLEFLQYGEVPAAATRETAVNALRLAASEHRSGFGEPLIGNLVEAALTFFETQSA